MSARRMAGAIAGGLIAGLAITAIAMKGERDSGKPSELADLERETAKRLGASTPEQGTLPGPGEQSVIQGGHLLLSAAAGAAFAAATDEATGIVLPGTVFGLVFYVAMHWVTGPALGLTKPEWRNGAKTIGMHGANHIAFGLVTAAGAKLAAATGRAD